MSFSKCPNLGAKNIIRFKLCHKRQKRSKSDLHLRKFQKQSFLDGFYAFEIKIKETFKLKTNLAKTKIKKSVLYKLCRIFFQLKLKLSATGIGVYGGLWVSVDING